MSTEESPSEWAKAESTFSGWVRCLNPRGLRLTRQIYVSRQCPNTFIARDIVNSLIRARRRQTVVWNAYIAMEGIGTCARIISSKSNPNWPPQACCRAESHCLPAPRTPAIWYNMRICVWLSGFSSPGRTEIARSNGQVFDSSPYTGLLA